MENKKLVIFDFDGVLVNTSDVVFDLHKQMNPKTTREFFDSMHNGNFHEKFQKAIKEGLIDAIPDFETKYPKIIHDIRTHDVISKLVEDLSKEYVLTIVSSTRSDMIIQKLEQEKIHEYFVDVWGHDVAKSKVVKIKKLLEKYSLETKDAIFITDTLGDINEGTECGVKSIGVTWGYHDRKTLEVGKPLAVVDTVSELENTISRFFRRD